MTDTATTKHEITTHFARFLDDLVMVYLGPVLQSSESEFDPAAAMKRLQDFIDDLKQKEQTKGRL